jgi:transcriptional regulator with XRE-family HTH domain
MTGAPALGALLSSYRRRAGLTQEELAERAGVSSRSISDVECGRIRWPQRRTREALAEVLGLDDAEREEFLRATKTGKLSVPEAPVPPAVRRSPLPPGVTDFTGRAQEMTALAGLAESGGIAVLHGSPGAGKTTIAVHFGHTAAASFPGGVAFVQGALRQDDLVAVVRGERVLVVLDDHGAEDLHAPPGCLVVVTTRRPRTADLVLHVGPLPEALELLELIIGRDRLRAEPEAAGEVVRLCGGLPLAVRIAGNRLLSRPRWPVAHLAEVLRDPERGVRVLAGTDDRLVRALEASSRSLSPAAMECVRAGEVPATAALRHELFSAGMLVPGENGGLSIAHLVQAYLIGRGVPVRADCHE